MKFSHAICDWPWWYANRLSGKGRTKFGSGAPGKYQTEKVTAAREFPVQDLCADKCMMYFWVTGPHLFDAEAVLNAWGFHFTTIGFTWVKTVIPRTPAKLKQAIDDLGMIGMLKSITRRMPGHYTASNAELVLLAWRGGPIPNTQMQHQTIYAPPTRHSRKPLAVHRYIDDAYPGSNCLELFAVPSLWTDPENYGFSSPNNWSYLGLEVDGKDMRESIPELAND